MPCKIREVLPSARHQKLSNTTGVSSRLTLFGCRKYFLNSYIIKISMFMLKKTYPPQCVYWKMLKKTWKEAPHPRDHQSHSPKMHPHCVDFIPIHPPYGDSPYSVREKRGKGFDPPKETVLTEIHEIWPSASLDIMKIHEVSLDIVTLYVIFCWSFELSCFDNTYTIWTIMFW